MSYFYGLIIAMQEGFILDSPSQCFYASYTLITSLDYMIDDYVQLYQTLNLFNAMVYQPMHAHGNLSAVYEYCNVYVFWATLELVFKPDLGAVAEIFTRWFVLLLIDSRTFWLDIIDLFEKPILDWYLIGYRVGMFAKLGLDFKLRT